MEQPLSPDVEHLLQNLQPEQAFNVRKAAVVKLGELNVSKPQAVNALIVAMESDPAFLVRKEARKSLQAPVHQEILEQQPDLMERTLEQVVSSGQLSEAGTQSERGQPATAYSSIPIPEDIPKAKLKKKRFEMLAPMLGIASVGACFGFFLLLGAKSVTLNDWLKVAPFLVLFVLAIFATSKLKQRELERWEDDLRNQLKR